MLLKNKCIPDIHSLDLAASQPGTEMFKLILRYAVQPISLEGTIAFYYYFSLFFRFIHSSLLLVIALEKHEYNMDLSSLLLEHLYEPFRLMDGCE